MAKVLAGFKIVRDYYYEAMVRDGSVDEDDKSEVGKESMNYAEGNDKVRCKVYDDDGTLYYEAVCTGESGAELFHNWGTGYAGTTASKIRKIGKGEKWGWFIG